MKISDVSIRNPVFAWMLMFALMIFGAISFSRMGLSQMPDVDFPMINISFTYDGAAPEVIESQVVDPVESVLMTIEGIQGISSSSKSGSASITVEFNLERDINLALQDVQAKVSAAQRLLPPEIQAPTISKTNPEDQPILWVALTSEDSDTQFLMQYARDYLKDRFTTVDGVGDIFLGGYTDSVLRVRVRPEDLQRLNVSVNDVLDAIKGEHKESPGGFVETEKNRFNIRTMGEAKNIEEFKNIILSKRGGQAVADPTNTVRLQQVADVSFGLDEIRRLSRFNGKPALGIGIRKQRGSNAVAVAQAVKKKMDELNKELPKGMVLSVNFDSTKFIEQSVHELNKHLVLAVLLTSLVCWAFLGSWSATFNVLLSIPTSLMGAFIGLYFLGYTLNTFTLLGLTLAIGIVVDDAIMVLENIFRYNEQGRGKIESAILGSREIAFAALAASAAVIAIFLPVAFMSGIIGKYFTQFGVTISFAVFLSLIESLTITPMRCAEFVHHGARSTRLGVAFENSLLALTSFYDKSLRKIILHPGKVVLGSLVFVALSFVSVKFLTKELSPSQDQSSFIARLNFPVGASLAYSDKLSKSAEAWLMAQPEVERVYSSVGGFGNGGGSADANLTMMFVTLKPIKERKMSQQEFMDVTRTALAKIPDTKPVLMDLSQRGFSGGRGYPIEFNLLGSDWDLLSEYTRVFKESMAASGLMVDVDSNFREGMPEIQVNPERTAAAYRGISISQIGTTVTSLIAGVKAGEFQKGGHRYDIKLKVVDRGDQLKEISSLLVNNSRGNLMPITSVSKQSETKSLQSISRTNRQRAISIYANLKTGVSQQDAMNFIDAKAKEILKPGYIITQGGGSQAFKDSFKSLFFALGLGFVIAYMVLASQFNSFLDPVSILMALPFSFSGAFFALLLTRQSLNMFSMIGLLLLMGIVKKNSILLIEFANTVRARKKLNAQDSLIEACPIRLRPILMTSVATIAAAVPSATAMGEGAETMRPMAVCLIGGVVVSTILTLYVVPCVYILLDRFRKQDTKRELVEEAFALVDGQKQ